ncbi:MAG: nucleotidyltransferase domain-containing protein [Candidatus Heimdallarchaeota archaeon]|nr:MAG: nucleotidyltransferase domain-containing protein [Candidatus Heimdallarchaeota archaeon]
MPREKVIRHIGREYHHYSEEEKRVFSTLRIKAVNVLCVLEQTGINAFVHGSVARGDITSASDVDIHIPVRIPSYQLDIIEDFKFADRRILMGTPNSTIHGVMSTHDNITISFPLSSPNEREHEFYRFSGFLYARDIQQNNRIPGVTKQLLLIEPKGDGYWISSISTNKQRAIKVLSLSQRIIDERIRVLERRDNIGRTGVLLDYSLSPDENFELCLKQIADRNVLVRRMLKRT